MKGVKFTAKEKERALKMWLVDGVHWLKVCKKNKCTRVSLWRWKAMYNGTLESLENIKPVPKGKHPKAHTDSETRTIKGLLDANPTMGYVELYGHLRVKHAYSRSFGGMNAFIRKNCLRPNDSIAEYVKHTPQEYDTPTMLGLKWQMDVKYVPTVCYAGKDGGVGGTRFYQYTMIDEASRERFIFAYDMHGMNETKDFIMRAIIYFGYVPDTVQTDNGKEFINHIVKKCLRRLKINHQRIKPRTPRHNGKVERSHRNDNNRFYVDLQFSDLSELRGKMAAYLVRSNNIPTSALRDRNGKQAWQTPLQKRAELLEILAEQDKPPPLRLANKLSRQDIIQFADKPRNLAA